MTRSERETHQHPSEQTTITTPKKKGGQPGQLRALNKQRSQTAQLTTERRIMQIMCDDPEWSFESIAQQIKAEGGQCTTRSGVQRAYCRAMGRHAVTSNREAREQSKRVVAFCLNEALIGLAGVRAVLDAGHFDTALVGGVSDVEAEDLRVQLEALTALMAVMQALTKKPSSEMPKTEPVPDAATFVEQPAPVIVTPPTTTRKVPISAAKPSIHQMLGTPRRTPQPLTPISRKNW